MCKHNFSFLRKWFFYWGQEKCYLRFPQHCLWRLLSSGLWYSLVWCISHTPHTPFLISHNTVIFSCKIFYFQVRYELVGRGKAQKYFQIDSDTGVIQVRDDLRKETATEYEVHKWVLFINNVWFCYSERKCHNIRVRKHWETKKINKFLKGSHSATLFRR